MRQAENGRSLRLVAIKRLGACQSAHYYVYNCIEVTFFFFFTENETGFKRKCLFFFFLRSRAGNSTFLFANCLPPQLGNQSFLMFSNWISVPMHLIQIQHIKGRSPTNPWQIPNNYGVNLILGVSKTLLTPRKELEHQKKHVFIHKLQIRMFVKMLCTCGPMFCVIPMFLLNAKFTAGKCTKQVYFLVGVNERKLMRNQRFGFCMIRFELYRN